MQKPASNVIEKNTMSPLCPFHWHEELEILLAKNKQTELCADGKIFTLPVGSFAIMAPFTLHNVDTDSFDCLCLNLRKLNDSTEDGSLKKFLPMLNARQSAPCIISVDDASFDSISKDLIWLMQNAEKINTEKNSTEANTQINAEKAKNTDLLGNQLKNQFFCTLEKLLNLLHSKNLVKQQIDTAEQKRLHTAKNLILHIHSNFMHQTSISDLSKIFGYSEFYLMKLFKFFAHQSIMNYLNLYRIHMAKNLLVCSQTEVSKIANQVGFSNISYFNRQFKHFFGMTPMQFRQKNSSMEETK